MKGGWGNNTTVQALLGRRELKEYVGHALVVIGAQTSGYFFPRPDAALSRESWTKNPGASSGPVELDVWILGCARLNRNVSLAEGCWSSLL